MTLGATYLQDLLIGNNTYGTELFLIVKYCRQKITVFGKVNVTMENCLYLNEKGLSPSFSYTPELGSKLQFYCSLHFTTHEFNSFCLYEKLTVLGSKVELKLL